MWKSLYILIIIQTCKLFLNLIFIMSIYYFNISPSFQINFNGVSQSEADSQSDSFRTNEQ